MKDEKGLESQNGRPGDYGIGSVLCCGLRGVGVLFLLFSIFSKTNLGPNYCHSEQLEFPKPREAAVLQDKIVSQGLC